MDNSGANGSFRSQPDDVEQCYTPTLADAASDRGRKRWRRAGKKCVDPEKALAMRFSVRLALRRRCIAWPTYSRRISSSPPDLLLFSYPLNFQLNHFTMSQPIRKLRVAVSGLGRMGARHANHFLHRTPKAELVAAFTPDERELAWGKEHLAPWGVKLYTDYAEMLKHEGLEAVCVATVTTVHAEHTIKAIEAGKHVLCEKPLSTKLDVVRTSLLPYS